MSTDIPKSAYTDPAGRGGMQKRATIGSKTLITGQRAPAGRFGRLADAIGSKSARGGSITLVTASPLGKRVDGAGTPNMGPAMPYGDYRTTGAADGDPKVVNSDRQQSAFEFKNPGRGSTPERMRDHQFSPNAYGTKQ